MTTMVQRTNGSRLPTLPVREAERMGARLLAGLDRMGFTHKNQDGTVFGFRFHEAILWGDELLSFVLDAEAMWHFATGDVANSRVTGHLSDVLRKPVRVMRQPLTFVIDLKPPKPIRLPTRVPLDLEQRPGDNPLLVPIGIGAGGTVWQPLPKMGHTLIVGASGAGKSSFIHAALAALLTGAGTDRLRLALVDPKRSELVPWARAPHLVRPVAHTVDDATELMGALVKEMDQRGTLLAGAAARDLIAYNRRSRQPLPHILIVIDETLDMVEKAKSELTDHLKAIATRGRSAGIILWCATQHAAAISGLPRVVNVNLASRIVFRVNDYSAAQVAGCPGAEHIDRRKPGRMLAKIDGPPVELQSYWLSDEALANVTARIAKQPAGPTLSDFERQLVHYAWDRLGGAFTVTKLSRAFHKGNDTINDLAARWEQWGWLTPPATQSDSRRVTEILLRVAGIRPAVQDTAQDTTQDAGGYSDGQ